MRMFCCGRPKKASPASAPQLTRDRLSPIDEDRAAQGPAGDRMAQAQPAGHRMFSRTFVSSFYRPSASIRHPDRPVRGAADARDAARAVPDGKPSAEEIRRFYALYGQPIRAFGTKTEEPAPAQAGPADNPADLPERCPS